MKMSNTAAIWYTSIEGITDPTPTLIDSGSSRNFINITFARRHSLPLTELQNPRGVIGINGKEVKSKIRFKTTINISIEGKTFKQRCYAMPLGDTNLILGLPWLQEADPEISWENMTIKYRNEAIRGKTSTEITQKEDIPEEFRKFANVFDEDLFKAIPPHRERFDCAIDLKNDAILPKPARPFPMSDAHSLALTEYLDKEIASGKIRERNHL